MKSTIEKIHKRTTEYSHPSQATTTANALELLSSGIYTEEERFVFELLQNAVDSYNPRYNTGLNVKIILTDECLIFLHNGEPFSERDLEGLCDIGNGNKMSDAKKIGYKGIGFKSVFMHSKRVTVVTAGTCFKFDKEECNQIAKRMGEEYYDVKMPWQIIPIPSEIPTVLRNEDYTVATVLEIHNKTKLLSKITKLLSDARFLLFLNVGNLRISLYDGDSEVLSLSKLQEEDLLTLSQNGVPQNKWLMYSKTISIPSDVKADMAHDAKTPDKLKNSDSVEISFAIALDKDECIVPLSDAIIYTYLPTSFSFGFNFVVNANFITDAGRQQLIKDCEWNKFIFSQIPFLYLNWIKDTVTHSHNDWYKILPPIKSGNDELTNSYRSGLEKAILSIPFVKTVNGEMILPSDAIFDEYNFCNALSTEAFDSFVKDALGLRHATESIISSDSGPYLTKYGVNSLSRAKILHFLENTNRYLNGYKISECENFVNWLYSAKELRNKELDNIISYSSILPCDDNCLHEPINTFFPSEFKNEEEMAKDAILINDKFCEDISNEVTSWLKDLGVQEMSQLSVIENVLCGCGYITAENAIAVLRYIFECNQDKNVFANILESKLSNIKLLTTRGNLKFASELYLSDLYNPVCKIQDGYNADIFVSNDYIKTEDDIREWSLFLKKLGVEDDIALSRIKYESDSWVLKDWDISNCVANAKRTEYNTAWDGRKFYLGCAGGVCVYAQSSVFLNPTLRGDDAPSYEFYYNFWGRIFSLSIPGLRQDYVHGNTGWGYTKQGYLSESKYLNKTFIEWLIGKYELIPASDKRLHRISEVLIGSKFNQEIFGKYYPVLSVNGEISDEWIEKLPLKRRLSLPEYLDVLEKISEDDSKDSISENKDRICSIYEMIADSGFDFTEGSSEYNLLRNWGKTHKLLSKELTFCYPESLCLLSSNITGVNIENQAYHRKSQENNRFASVMTAFGVSMISNHSVEGLDDTIDMPDIKKRLTAKSDFFTVLTNSESFSDDSWREAHTKMDEAIDKLNFFKANSIHVVYGTQSIDKPIYVKDNNLYFVGKFGAGVQELLSSDIVRLLGLHKGDQTTFLTILRMSDFEEIKDYLSQKGYDTSFLKEPQLPQITESSLGGAVLEGENPSYGGLTKDQMRAALIEAKDAILAKLSCEGYDTSSAQWDGWTCVDGIQKGGIEYPLVIRSNKSGRNTILSDIDWNQLLRPNAMFVVNTNNGIGTINFKQLLKSKENITIRFGSENIDIESRISRLAEAFSFFKGMQFDFESYVTPVISRWQSFMAPEKNTGETAATGSVDLMPQ